jgi:hypothetical protein
MKDVLKTFACVSAYAAGVVIGVTVAGVAISKVETFSAKRRVKKASEFLAAAEANLEAVDTAVNPGTLAQVAIRAATARGNSAKKAAA